LAINVKRFKLKIGKIVKEFPPGRVEKITMNFPLKFPQEGFGEITFRVIERPKP